MTPAIIKKDSIEFLEDLAKNNNREWFNQHKERYAEARSNIIDFADALIGEMNKQDKIETGSGKDSLFRIYKDVRFSKDKTPYNKHWSCALKRAGKQRRGGYYLRIEPGNSRAVTGFFGPVPADMKRIRQDIDINYPDWGKVLAGKELIETFGRMSGQKLVSAPRGYAIDHPGIELLRHKQFLFRHEFSDLEVLSPDFLFRVSDTLRKIRPFLDYMSEVLTTDVNGLPLSG